MQYSARSVSITLNSTVRIPPRTKKVGQNGTLQWYQCPAICARLSVCTLQEVWLEVDIEDVAAQAFDGVVEGKDVETLPILDIQARVHVDHVTELDAEFIAHYLVHLDLALLNIVGAQADQHGIMPLLPAKYMVSHN